MKFEVGMKYFPNRSGVDPIRIERRTEKSIWATDGKSHWRMKVRTDEDGNEYAFSSVWGEKWRDEFTYRALPSHTIIEYKGIEIDPLGGGFALGFEGETHHFSTVDEAKEFIDNVR